jgi:hypothetical protein
MSHRSRRLLSLGVIMTASLSLAGPVLAAPRLTATLLGANLLPGPGDPDGSGTAVVRLNSGKGEVCIDLTVSGIEPFFSAHIQQGTADVNGPLVVPLNLTPESPSVCRTGVDSQLIKAIAKQPGNYYVNVRNSDYPAGALRGQLSK